MKILVPILTIFIFINLSLGEECIDQVQKATNISAECAKQLKILCTRRDILFTMWDSSSRIIHTGMTGTNNMDLGNYDLCMLIDNNENGQAIAGKFCPLNWRTIVPKEYLELLVEVEERRQIPSHPVKWTNNITMAGSICIPDACTPQEFTQFFNPYLFPVVYSSSETCVTKSTKFDFSVFELVSSICLGLVLLVTVACTVHHIVLYYLEKDEPHDCIKAFSILYNGRKLLTINKNNSDQFQCMHGMRFISMLWVVAGHTYASLQRLPHVNQKDVDEWEDQLYSQYIDAAHYAVDTFFFLSGFLLAFSYLKQSTNLSAIIQVKRIPLMYLYRYLRLTPAVAALFFFSLSFFKVLGDGPLWLKTLNFINEPCREYWWRYFLYIQNYTPDDFCYIQTWYLSADMQLFILAPLVLIPSTMYYAKKLRLVISGLFGLAVFCVGLSIAIPYIVKDYENDYDTHSRLSNYLVGIISGILMYTLKGKPIKINKVINLVMWAVVLVIMVFLGLYKYDVRTNKTKIKSSIYDVVSKPVWCMCISWIVFSCYFGYGGIVNKFLSHPIFQVGSRLSYCMYVVHASVVLYMVGSTRTYIFFSDYLTINMVWGNTIATTILAAIWTFAFESPMIMLNKMLFSWIDSLSVPRKLRQQTA